MPNSPEKVPVEERLFSLVLALLATESGLTKGEVLSTVQGYRQRYSVRGENASLERQFERDKDDIRELGIPLETLEQPGEPGNNQTLRYRIPKGSYDLPADIRFSAQEMTLLSLAAAVWREGSLSAESRRAIIKLRSLGVESDEPIIGYAPRLRTREAAFAPLNVALERKVVVTFDYLKPGEPASRRRTVEPLALVQHVGRWLLRGIDRGVGELRTFLLSRIIGEVTVTSTPFTTDDEVDYAADVIAELEAIRRRNVADIVVEPQTDAATRIGKRAGTEPAARNHLLVHYSDMNILADELAGYGPEVLVVSPADLRDAVVRRLKTTVRTHTMDAEASVGR